MSPLGAATLSLSAPISCLLLAAFPLNLSISLHVSPCSFLSLLPCLSLPESFAERRWPSPSGSERTAGDGGAGNSRVEERDGEIYDIEND